MNIGAQASTKSHNKKNKNKLEACKGKNYARFLANEQHLQNEK